MPAFKKIYERAIERKGSESALRNLLTNPRSANELEAISEDRYLAAMTMCVNQAGFSWKVIEKKWPEFEEAFFGFKVDTLILLSDEQWESYTQDRRVVRSWQKIKTVKENANFLYLERLDHGGIGHHIAHWPSKDQIGLQAYLKKHGSRLGGNTAQWFLRRMGKDCFVLSRDVIGALITSGLDISEKPTTKKDLKLIQETLNAWHEESGLPYTHLSQIAAYSFGDNKI